MAGKMNGDLLRVRTEFRIHRSDFNIGPQVPSLGDEIELRCSFVGMREVR